jgi:hypothetical protein
MQPLPSSTGGRVLSVEPVATPHLLRRRPCPVSCAGALPRLPHSPRPPPHAPRPSRASRPPPRAPWSPPTSHRQTSPERLRPSLSLRACSPSPQEGLPGASGYTSVAPPFVLRLRRRHLLPRPRTSSKLALPPTACRRSRLPPAWARLPAARGASPATPFSRQVWASKLPHAPDCME